MNSALQKHFDCDSSFKEVAGLFWNYCLAVYQEIYPMILLHENLILITLHKHFMVQFECAEEIEV